jgi:phage gpG-like protein
MIPITTQIDDKELLGAFVKLEGLYEDLKPIFEAVGEEFLADTRKHIENHPGPGLKAATIKKKGSTRILRDTDNLYGSFVKGASGNVTRITATEGEFGSNVSYGMFHQTGTKRMPQRTIIEVTGEQEAKYSKIALDTQTERIRALGFEIR